MFDHATVHRRRKNECKVALLYFLLLIPASVSSTGVRLKHSCSRVGWGVGEGGGRKVRICLSSSGNDVCEKIYIGRAGKAVLASGLVKVLIITAAEPNHQGQPWLRRCATHCAAAAVKGLTEAGNGSLKLDVMLELTRGGTGRRVRLDQ